MRADLGPVVSKAHDDSAQAARTSAPEPLPSLAAAPGKSDSHVPAGTLLVFAHSAYSKAVRPMANVQELDSRST